MTEIIARKIDCTNGTCRAGSGYNVLIDSLQRLFDTGTLDYEKMFDVYVSEQGSFKDIQDALLESGWAYIDTRDLVYEFDEYIHWMGWIDESTRTEFIHNTNKLLATYGIQET